MPFRFLVAAWSLAASLVGFGTLTAQEAPPSDWFYRAWQTEDGLPGNSISGVAQSPDGYLWVGTNGGPMRFNGTEFQTLPLRDLPGLSEIPSRQVRAMFLDRRGDLWLSTERGPVIRLGDDAYQTFTNEDGILKRTVTSMTDDPKGRVWIGFFNGVCRIDGDEVTQFKAPQQMPMGGRVSLSCDRLGQVWLAIGSKLGRLSDSGFELIQDFGEREVKIAPSQESTLWVTVGSSLGLLNEGNQFAEVARLPKNVSVNAIFEDQEGCVWIGTERAGLFRVEGSTFVRVATSHASVLCLAEDREGNIWAGTKGGGLNVIRPRLVKFIESANGLPFRSVRSTTCDTSGRVWAVSGNGLLAYQRDNRWQRYTGFSKGEQVNCVTADSSGGIWAGTREHGLLRIGETAVQSFGARDGLASLSVRSLITDRRGQVWVATDNPAKLHRVSDDALTSFEHEGSLRFIRAMAESADGTIWIGTSVGRLLRVDGNRLIDESGIAGPALLSIRTLHATPDGSLWIGYAGDGLGHLKDGVYRRVTTDVGLHDDYISQIQDDDAGSLWMAANRGLFQVGLEELLTVSVESKTSAKLRCRAFSRLDGVPSIQPSRDYAPAASRGQDGRLYFATQSGILKLEPNKLRENSPPPPVILEKASLDDEIVAVYKPHSTFTTQQVDLSLPAPELNLPPDHDRLAIDFAALSLASPENVNLRYRLQPMQTRWEEVENQRDVTFPRLPAGDYEFQVIACNSVGVWNEEGATLGIVVSPFYWQTWWFRIGGGVATALAAGGMVFLGLRRRHRHQLRRLAAKRALEQERSRIARDIHDDLGASLTRITLLSQSSPPTGDVSTNAVLDQIHATSRELMRSMEEVVWAVNPEHDTFDALANYLSNYGQGFLSIAGVRCRLDMPMSLPEHPLSAQIRHNLFLAFKEALNNAVKYAAATEVRISLQPGSDAFVLKVEDDGEGINTNATTKPMRPTAGSGLANMKSRMEEIGGHCNVDSSPGQGTTVEFRVPFKIDA